jgi:prolyl 4-hydroxylase
MKLDPQGWPLDDFLPIRLSDRPSILHVSGFLSEAECQHVIDVGTPHLRPSVVVDPDSGRMIPHPVRTSDYAMFGVHTEDLVISSINRRLAALTGTDYRQGEPLQLLRYGVGGEYRAHMDALPNEPNQRILTAIVYLNDGYQGGATEFPRIDLSFTGRRGDALIFSNVLDEDRPDPLSLHVGARVTAGVKKIATRWIRRGVFTYPPPRPILTALS